MPGILADRSVAISLSRYHIGPDTDFQSSEAPALHSFLGTPCAFARFRIAVARCTIELFALPRIAPGMRGREEREPNRCAASVLPGASLVSMTRTFLTTLPAIAIGMALLSTPARSGDCGDLRPLWIPPSQPLPACLARGVGGPWTLNPLRTARGVNCRSGCRAKWLPLFRRKASSCDCGPAPCAGEAGVVSETVAAPEGQP
jgi:hypothetical protein